MSFERLVELIADDPIVVTGMGVHCAAGIDVDDLVTLFQIRLGAVWGYFPLH